MAKTTKKTAQKKVVQVGNFFVKKESEHYKICDVNNIWTMRVHYLSSMYTFLDVLIEQGSRDLLEVIVKLYYSIGTTPPDSEFLHKTFDAYLELVERTKPYLKTDEEDAQELERARHIHEGTEQLKQMMDDDRHDENTQG